MKLRTKFALVLISVLLLLSAANVGALLLYEKQTVSQERGNVAETANLTSSQIEKTVNLRKGEVSFAGQKYPHDDLDEARPYTRSFLDHNQHFVVASVLAPNGTVVMAVGDGWTEEARREEVGTSYADERYVRASRNGTVYVTQPNTELVTVTAPIYGSNGEKIVGLLRTAARIDAVSFFQMLRPLETGHQTVVVTGPDGRSLRAPQQQFDSSINATAEVEGVGWDVTVSRDRSQLDARLQQLAVLQGLSLLVVFGTVLGFGAWEYRSNLRQTERLLDGFERIKGGNYGYRLSLASAEEWRQISDGFNDLARGLAIREAQLLEREQRLGVLNRVIRHNVRNEMSVILNYAQLIQETTDDDQAEMAADTIVNTGRTLTELSEKARQIETALENADRGLVEQDVVGLVEGIVDDVRDDDEVDVVFEAPDELSVAAIPSLEVAIDNVVENAIKHNDADRPRVEIALGQVTREGERRIDLKVADNGPGIPEQEKNVLVEGRETALEHGSGLGLWLVYWVVDKSDGNLRFDENDPRGSIVTLEFHARVPDDVTPTPPIESVEDGSEPELPGPQVVED